VNSFRLKVAAFAAGLALVAALGGVGTASAASAAACKAGKASTAAAPCTRAWVAAGCNQFVPLVKSAFAASVTAPVRFKTPGGPTVLNCGFTVDGAKNAFGFLFVPRGATPAIFAGVQAGEQMHIVGCQATQVWDAATQTPAAAAKPLPGVGDQSFVHYACPGGFVAYENSGDQQVLTNIASAYVRRGATAYTSGSANVAALKVFMKQLVARYP
jgi:hypothetical protein